MNQRQKIADDPNAAQPEWLNFLRGYHQGTADPYINFVYEAGQKYCLLLEQGASPNEIQDARESLMHYWNKWELSASDHVRRGRELYLSLSKEKEPKVPNTGSA
jgi:hypothetical protein